MLFEVRELKIEDFLPGVCNLIRLAFSDVAEEFHLTPQNCRYHPAFLSDSDFADSLCRPGVICLGAFANDLPGPPRSPQASWGDLVGFAAVWPKTEDAFAIDQSPVLQCPDTYELTRLCVLPEHRHAGLGGLLLRFALQSAREHGARNIEIGMIAENERLRAWYERHGFRVTAVREYAHLPFRVCEMERTALPQTIHILGASGSGTSTLGRALEVRCGYRWLDTDDFFWMPTDPPFTQKRPAGERVALLSVALDKHPHCVVSGHMSGWGDVFLPKFELIVWLQTPTEVRLERLRRRERERFGPRVLPGGDMHGEHLRFLGWAGRYDSGGETMRSRTLEERWLKSAPCPVKILEGTRPVEYLIRTGCAIQKPLVSSQ